MSEWIQWALSGIGICLAGVVGWLVHYERRTTRMESAQAQHGKDIAVLFEKDNALNTKIDVKLDHLEKRFQEEFQGVRNDIKDLIREVAKAK